MKFIDVHAHLNDAKYGGDLEPVFKAMQVGGVDRVINVGFDLKSSIDAKDISERYEGAYFCPGVHPDDAKTVNGDVLAEIERLSDHPKCVAIGEIGFDFYWNKSTEEEQIYAFEKQMELADGKGLPFVVHSRDASAKTIAFLKDRKSLINHGFLMHCYSESAESAKIYESLGAYFSFGGVITFKNAKKGEILKSIGLDRIMTETDCPYLSPEPFRGQMNDPSRVAIIADKMAEIFGVSTEEIAEKTVENAERLFFKLKCN
ncbi:MAG: TatD family hydrolase [Clostridia bacterium]|nr:TatD family hydrolase [Clostridia bacterium]